MSQTDIPSQQVGHIENGGILLVLLCFWPTAEPKLQYHLQACQSSLSFRPADLSVIMFRYDKMPGLRFSVSYSEVRKKNPCPNSEVIPPRLFLLYFYLED